MADDDELEDEPDPPTPADRNRAVKRLAQAVLLQALFDFTRAQETGASGHMRHAFCSPAIPIGESSPTGPSKLAPSTVTGFVRI